jgi:hypothetical protein
MPAMSNSGTTTEPDSIVTIASVIASSRRRQLHHLALGRFDIDPPQQQHPRPAHLSDTA